MATSSAKSSEYRNYKHAAELLRSQGHLWLARKYRFKIHRTLDSSSRLCSRNASQHRHSMILQPAKTTTLQNVIHLHEGTCSQNSNHLALLARWRWQDRHHAKPRNRIGNRGKTPWIVSFLALGQYTRLSSILYRHSRISNRSEQQVDGLVYRQGAAGRRPASRPVKLDSTPEAHHRSPPCCSQVGRHHRSPSCHPHRRLGRVQ